MTNRGQAVVEVVLASIGILLFATIILIAVYLLFVRAWIQYGSEQALYCLMQQQPAQACQAELESFLRSTLYWGHTKEVRMRMVQKGKLKEWKIHTHWNFVGLSLHVERQISARDLTHKRALHW